MYGLQQTLHATRAGESTTTCGSLYHMSLTGAGPEPGNVAKQFPEDSFSFSIKRADVNHDNVQNQGGSKGTNKRKRKKANLEECPVCHSQFRRLGIHLRKNHRDYIKLHWKSVCGTCGDVYPTQGTLQCHITTCHQPSGETVTQEMLETAIEYMRTTGFLSYFCQTCAKYFPNKALLDLHEFSHRPLDDHKDRKERQCPGCDFTGTSFSEVVLHTKEHTIGSSERKQCFFCTDKLTNLAQHYKLMHPEYREIISKDWPFECDSCHMKFFAKHYMDTHIRAVHGKLQCIYCAVQFDNNREIGKHLPEHKKDGVFPCPYCPKAFPVYFRFRDHYRRAHDVNRIHLCEICQFVCKNRILLHNHMESHKKDFRFVCKECGKRFHAARYLRGHVRWVHEGNLKDYKKNYLKKRKEKEQDGLVGSYIDPRRKLAFEDFPYKCHECHLGYMRRGTLMNHVKQKHPEKDPESIPL